MPNRRPQLEIVAPSASPEEAAAVVAALEQFLRDFAPVIVEAAPQANPWQRAALLEATGREPDAPVALGRPGSLGQASGARAPTRHVCVRHQKVSNRPTPSVDPSKRPEPPADANAFRRPSMQYMLLIYTPADPTPSRPSTAAWMSYSQQLQESGAMVAGDGLQGLETATTVRVRDGESLVTDGPFAETKEMLAGYYLIDVARPRRARSAWAAKIPSVGYGSVEVRPVMVFDQG